MIARAGVIAVACAASLGLTGPIAVSLAPVVWSMHADPVLYDGDTYTARITGRKIRDCVPALDDDGDGFIGWYFDGRVWTETGLTFPNDASPGSSNPSGGDLQDFGLFRWHDLPPQAAKVRVTNIHNCDGRLTVTTTGPFDLPPQQTAAR